MSTIRLVIKRILDLLVACILAAVVLPIGLVIAGIVKVSSRGPVFFIQERAGKGGKRFNIYKFRTMYHGSNPDKGVEEADPRITSVGHFLREWSLDELPQLINVLKGDMSLVGPRPLLVDYVARYTNSQRRRLEVRPGITGFQQVMCRYDTTWEKKFAYDLYYVKNFTLCFDLWILLKTAKVVLFRPASAIDGGRTYVFEKKLKTDANRKPGK